MSVTGPSAIETWRVQEFSQNIQMLLQRDGRLGSLVQRGTHNGKQASPVDQIGDLFAEERLARNVESNIQDIDYDRRWVRPRDWSITTLVDSIDRLRNMNEPDSNIAMAMQKAMRRREDQAIIDGALGDNLTGEEGTTTTAFDADNIIPDSATGLTVEKLREAKEILENNHVEFGMEDVTMVITPRQERNLLEETEITSADFNTVRALVNGEVDSFMGFRFVKVADFLEKSGETLGLPIDGSDIRGCFAFARSGLHLGHWQNVQTRIDEIPRMHHATQIATNATFDATRLEEGKVVRINCLEA